MTRKIIASVSTIALIIAAVLFNTSLAGLAPLVLIGGIAGIAIATSAHKLWGGFSFSLWILAAVVASLAYPEYFISVGSFKTKLLIVPLLQIIMFGMGSQMSLNDFKGVMKMPKGVIIGVICQFSIMPIIGFSITYLFSFPPELEQASYWLVHHQAEWPRTLCRLLHAPTWLYQSH